MDIFGELRMSLLCRIKPWEGGKVLGNEKSSNLGFPRQIPQDVSQVSV